VLRFVVAMSMLSACSIADRITGPLDVLGPDGEPIDPNRPCPTNLTFFRETVTPQVLMPDCMQCHRADGFAKDTRFILVPPDQPDANTMNFETMRSVAGTVIEGESIILLKPTLRVSHGGGQRFPVSDDRFKVLQELVFRFGNPDECYQGEEPSVCEQPVPHPGDSPVRPLTSAQWENTVRDLFAGVVDPTGLFPPTQIAAGYSTFVSANIVSEAKAEDILVAAETIARRATLDLPGLLQCAEGQAEQDCVAAFVDRFGLHAYRRPLRDTERTILMSLYGVPDFDLTERVGMIIEAALQSPQFLYIDDTGGEPAGEGIEQLDDYAMAQRLSYFFWNTMPDDSLFTAAAEGRLSDAAGVRAEAARMIDDPRALQTVAAFHRDWLQVFGLEEVQKDPQVYPIFSPVVAHSMMGEIDRFVDHVVFDQNGTLRDLLTSRATYSDAMLDDLYGTFSGSSGPDDFRPVALPANQRSGLLTRAAFLSKHAHNAASSPIARGVFVIRNLLCQDLVIPPGLVAGEIPLVEGGTIRERFAVHRSQEACAACHDKIDPLGFAFESYDGVGMFRTLYENGREIETTGNYEDLGIGFENAIELTDRLVESSLVRDCYATQWFRYAIGRVETDDDCSLIPLRTRFGASGGNVKDLLLGIAESDAFRYRRTGL
jgi:hypothetical protein